MTSTLKEFGQAVFKARNAKGWTLENLAHEAFGNGDRKSYLSQIEHGRRNISRATVMNLQRALDLPDTVVDPALGLGQPEPAPTPTEATADRIYDATSDAQHRLKIGESLAIALAYKYAQGTPADMEAALRGLERALEVAANRPAPSNLPSEVDDIVAEADRLSDAGELDAALAYMQQAVSDSADRIAREEQARAQLVDSAIAKATLARNADVLADLLVAQITAQGGTQEEQFKAVRAEQDVWYERGRDQGLSFDLEAAIALAQRSLALAQNANKRGLANNDLGNALQILGERASNTDLLEQAVTAYRAALTELTQDRVPLDWAMTQNNLGNALQTLGARASDTELLQQAVTAFCAALTEQTQNRVPLEWAMTQNNLGNALKNLGARAKDTDLLEQAVTAYRAALTEYTQDRLPLEWAMTQNNLGNALKNLGARAKDKELLEKAVTAYRAALTECTRDRVPLDWAGTQFNLALAFEDLAALTDGAAAIDHLKTALSYVDAALTVFSVEQMPYNHDTATRLRDDILAKLHP